MVLNEFQKASLERFMGLYDRGGYDGTPPDHATDISNIAFSDTGEIYTRPGSRVSLSLFHPIKRMFLATPSHGYDIITWDGGDNLYRYNPDTNTDVLLLTETGMLDFCALNIFGKTYIMPSGPAENDFLVQVWDGTTLYPALGKPPNLAASTTFSATAGTTGWTDPGVHKWAVSFITNTHFTTRPGPEDPADPNPVTRFHPISMTAPGGTNTILLGIPTGGANVIARQLYVTKADQEEYFFVADGYIDDNTTTTKVISYYDTDLVVSADSLFDLRDSIPGGVGTSFGLFKYHGRMLAWGSPDLGQDNIIVSDPGEPEAFNTVTGNIQVPSEFDGNVVRSMATLRDTLYLIKGVGIYSTQDNLDTPSTWPVVQVDGGVGCWFYGLSTITASQPSLSMNEVLIMASRGGLYLFNGIVHQPPLTYKVNDVWLRFNHVYQDRITIAIDPFDQLLYCLLPLDGATEPNFLLVGDFSEGLDANNIKWSVYNFPFIPRSIGLINFQDQEVLGDGVHREFEYHLRIGSDDNKLYKLVKGKTDDVETGVLHSHYQTYLGGYELGQMSIFRALVIRGQGETINVTLGAQDLQRLQDMTSFIAGFFPGKEYTRQINYTSEKMLVKLSSDNPFRIGRIDAYGKVQFNSRPL